MFQQLPDHSIETGCGIHRAKGHSLELVTTIIRNDKGSFVFVLILD